MTQYFVSRDTWSIYHGGEYFYFHDLQEARAFGKEHGLTGKHIYSEVLGRYVKTEKEEEDNDEIL